MLNWLARYAPAAAALVDEAGEARGSILDVGCGPHGLACARPDVPFVGLDVEYPAAVAPSMTAVRAEPGPLPFADGSFDVVLSLDTLEHIPRPDRAGFVAELCRVAAKTVLLACPSADCAELDAAVRRRFESMGVGVPSWLAEHDEHRLPERDEIERDVRAVAGFEAEPWPMVNGTLAAAVTFADLFELGGAAAQESAERTADWVRLLGDAAFGPSFRAGWVITRTSARTAVVDRDDLGGTLPAALVCPACGGGFEAGADVLRCTGCGATAGRDAQGAWALPARGAAPATAPAPAEAPAPVSVPAAERASALRRPAEGVSLRLAPRWSHVETWLPALSAYLTHAKPFAGNELFLDASSDGLGTEVVGALVEGACEALAPSGQFADVVVLGAGEPAPVAEDVRDAADVRAALGAEDPQPPADAAAVVHRARWGKALADELQGFVDGQLFRAAPDVFDDAEPLISVRIPTWNGHQRLVERTLPSVLGGSWANLEVLVCSDGPDPVARAAVEAVGDRRVRYLEVPERPVYASHPWSFWETAGTAAANTALDAARGAWIAPLDHDDEFTLDHLRTLQSSAREARRDFVYGQALMEQRQGPPHVLGRTPLAHGHICHGTVLYSSRLAHMRYDPHAWLLEEPGDWNMWRRMQRTGVEVGFLPTVVLLHSVERTAIEDRVAHPDAVPHRTAAELATDVLGTSARWYLDVAPVPAPAAEPAIA